MSSIKEENAGPEELRARDRVFFILTQACKYPGRSQQGQLSRRAVRTWMCFRGHTQAKYAWVWQEIVHLPAGQAASCGRPGPAAGEAHCVQPRRLAIIAGALVGVFSPASTLEPRMPTAAAAAPWQSMFLLNTCTASFLSLPIIGRFHGARNCCGTVSCPCSFHVFSADQQPQVIMSGFVWIGVCRCKTNFRRMIVFRSIRWR